MKIKHLLIFLGVPLLLMVLSNCECQDGYEIIIEVNGLHTELLNNTDQEVEVDSSGSIPANVFALSIQVMYEQIAERKSTPSWQIIPSAYALSCAENIILNDSIQDVRFYSTASFGVDYPAGSDISSFFSFFDYYEFVEADDHSIQLDQNNYFYLFGSPEQELEHRFIIELETRSGMVYRDTTNIVLLTL